MFARKKRSASLVLALACWMPLGTALAIDTPSVSAFQQILLRQADQQMEDRFAVMPLYPDAAGRAFALALLQQLGRQPAYLDDMQQWLAANPALSQEELVAGWFRHYHQVLVGSFDFLADQDVTVLWQLKDRNVLPQLERGACRTQPAEQIDAAVTAARAGLVERNKAALSSAISSAYLQELARIKAPRPGDRPVGAVQTGRAMRAFQSLVRSLPAADGALLSQAFSYGSPTLSAAEACERQWVSSRAIAEAAVDDAAHLRNSITRSGYQDAFLRADRLDAPAHPAPKGFRPGKKRLALPILLQRHGVAGTSTVDVTADSNGKVTGVTVTSVTLAPRQVTSADGTTYAAIDLLLPVIDAYFRDGGLAPTIVDGVATPTTIQVRLQWK